jgi:hypothetical protein
MGNYFDKFSNKNTSSTMPLEKYLSNDKINLPLDIPNITTDTPSNTSPKTSPDPLSENLSKTVNDCPTANIDEQLFQSSNTCDFVKKTVILEDVEVIETICQDVQPVVCTMEHDTQVINQDVEIVEQVVKQVSNLNLIDSEKMDNVVRDIKIAESVIDVIEEGVEKTEEIVEQVVTMCKSIEQNIVNLSDDAQIECVKQKEIKVEKEDSVSSRNKKVKRKNKNIKIIE